MAGESVLARLQDIQAAIDKIVFDVVQHDLPPLAEIVRAEIPHLTENP